MIRDDELAEVQLLVEVPPRVVCRGEISRVAHRQNCKRIEQPARHIVILVKDPARTGDAAAHNFGATSHLVPQVFFWGVSERAAHTLVDEGVHLVLNVRRALRGDTVVWRVREEDSTTFEGKRIVALALCEACPRNLETGSVERCGVGGERRRRIKDSGRRVGGFMLGREQTGERRHEVGHRGLEPISNAFPTGSFRDIILVRDAFLNAAAGHDEFVEKAKSCCH